MKTQSASQNPASEIVTEYCRRFPDAPSRTLARLIFRQHPLEFLSFDTVYQAVRHRFGNKGKKSRQGRNKHLNRDLRESAYIPRAEVELEWAPVELGEGKTLVLPDIHVPFQDNGSVRIAIEHGKKVKPSTILLNGDFLDCHQLSKFSRRPTVAHYHHEVETGILLLEAIREAFPKATIIWRSGNHEDRFIDYMSRKCVEFWGVPQFDLRHIMHLKEFGVQYVPEMCPVTAGSLEIYHGNEFPSGMVPSVNPARGAFLKSYECVIVSHHHQSSNHVETTIKGRLISTWSTGCLCQLRPRYRPVNKWNLGFAVVEHNKKEFSVDNRRIYAGKSW